MIRQLLRPLLLAGDEQDKRSCLHFSKMQEMFSVPTRAPDMKVHLAPPMAWPDVARESKTMDF